MKVRVASESYRRKLSNDIQLADQQDGEIQAHLAKLLCIRISGYIEVFLKERILTFVDNRRSHQIISEYIKNAIGDISNLRSSKIETVLRSFSGDWAHYYAENITEEQKTSLGSIYAARNSIAHGGNDSLSLRDIKRHFSNIESALDVIDKAIAK